MKRSESARFAMAHNELAAALAASAASLSEQQQLEEALRLSNIAPTAPSAFAASAAVTNDEAEAIAIAALSVPASSAFAAAASLATNEAEALALATSISANDEAERAAADAAALEKALQASLADALASEGVRPGAPMPSIASRQRSRQAYPAFTAVSPAVVHGLSTEAELERQDEEVAPMGPPVALVDPFPSRAPPMDLNDFEPPPPIVRPQTSDEVRALVTRLEEEERAAELGPSFACGICLEDALPNLAGHRLGCGHIFCTPCISEHVKIKIRAHDVSSDALTCPECTAPIRVSDVHALTWRCGDDETWRRYEAAADNSLIESLVRDGGARRCPSERCNYAFVWSDGDARHFDCPACASSFCLACPCVGGGVGPAHPGVSCAEYEEQLKADAEAKRRLEEWRVENSRADERFNELMRSEMRAGDTKPCPKCKQPITKNGGCHHHLCTWCKVKFCWNCGGFNASRPNTNTCGTTCGKPARKWWAESELFAQGGGLSSSGAGSSGAAPLDDLRARIWSIYHGLRGPGRHA